MAEPDNAVKSSITECLTDLEVTVFDIFIIGFSCCVFGYSEFYPIFYSISTVTFPLPDEHMYSKIEESLELYFCKVRKQANENSVNGSECKVYPF